MVSPPVFTGAVQSTLTEPFPRITDTPLGGSGTVAGVTGADTDEAVLFPTEFAAYTLNV